MGVQVDGKKFEVGPYRGYTGVAEWDEGAGLWYGSVRLVRDIVTFQATTTEGVEAEFVASVDDYLAWCAERGDEPSPPAPAEAGGAS